MTRDCDKNGSKITVLLVEDHEIMRFGLRKSLEKFSNLHVVGEAIDGLEAVDRARALAPCVVLMDIGLPSLSGIEATRRIKAESPDVRIIMLTSYEDEERTCGALAAGADAYCCKSIKTDELIKVIEKVNAGECWLDPVVAGFVVKIYTSRSIAVEDSEVVEAVVEEDTAELDDLTAREVSILRHLMVGKSEAEIAMHLSVNENTVRSHVRRILKKLAADERSRSYLAHITQGS